jgi:hypothetical protein
MDYVKLCKDILNVDPKIRYAGICDDTGETKYGGNAKVFRIYFHLRTQKDQIYKH